MPETEDEEMRLRKTRPLVQSAQASVTPETSRLHLTNLLRLLVFSLYSGQGLFPPGQHSMLTTYRGRQGIRARGLPSCRLRWWRVF